MKRSFLLLIPALFALLIVSCKKGEEGPHNTVTPGSGFRSLDEAINSTAPKAKSTSLSVSGADTLFGPGGTKFIIPANVFETLTGGKVTGSVNITVNDWLHKGDMVFGRVLPNNFERLLQSGGEAFIQITQNGQILRIRKDTFVTVMFPQFGSGVTGMTGWVGRSMIGSANTVNWIPAVPGLLTPTDIADTVSVRADTLHYIQAALPYAPPESGNYTVRLTSSVVMEQSMAVALVDGVKTIFPLPSAQNGQVNVINGPTKVPLHIAVMGINKGQFFGGIVAVDDPRSDSTYSVTLKAMEPPTLRLQLNAL
jgi:hypothetical protein